MPSSINANTAQKTARKYMDSGLVGDEIIRRCGIIGQPIVVKDQDAKAAGWFVPVTTKNKLVGYLQLTPIGDLLRYVSFQHAAASLEDSPDAATWTDAATILALAKTRANPNDKLAAPYLTYDHTPTRLVWAVKATDRQRHEKTIYVAGDYVYVKPEETAEASYD